MAPVPPKKRIDDSFELKLYNSTNEPINFQLGTPSSFGLGAGSETIEALSTSSCIITPTFSPRNGVEITLDGTPYRINSPKSCGKGWIALDKDFTRSRVLIPIGERESKGNEKSVVQEPRFLVYQLGEVRTDSSSSSNSGNGIDVVELVVVPAISLKSWASRIPGTMNLSEIYIPGTHESMALFGYPHSTCQYDPTEILRSPQIASTPAPKIGNITNQLNNGVRFLDLRFSLFPVKSKSTSNSRFFPPSSNRAEPKRPSSSNIVKSKRQEFEGYAEKEWELQAYHGIINQKITAKEVFEEIYQFLDSVDGSNETIIVSVKQENAADSSAFAQTVHNLINAPRTRSKWFTDARWPRMEEVRGKIVLFCRFQHWENGGGLHTPRWDDASKEGWETIVGGERVLVQDWYKISSFKNITQKANLVLSLFDSTDFSAASPPSHSFRRTGSISPTKEGSKFRLSLQSTSTNSFDSTSTSTISPLALSDGEMKIQRAPIPLRRPIRINFTSGSSFPFFPPILVARGVGSNLSLSVRAPISAGRRAKHEGREQRWRMRLTRRVQGVNELVFADLLRRIKAPLDSADLSGGEAKGGGGMMILTDYVKPSDGFTQLIIALNRISL